MPAKSKSPARQSASPKRVLVVEDEPLIEYDLISEIEADDHVVIGQCNLADAAIQMAENLRPDVVVMDIGLLRDQSGLDAAREIRTRFGIGCIFVSATLDRVEPEQWADIRLWHWSENHIATRR